ncbi:hypothetical protein CMI37_26760 [Candidatus Pacearchaeota archaeon]|mgnify:CR=1 FL=1|nr:hypothetical protein [Candidatus Pacearchaeota archaeon]|tara:strand:+ start:3554 stop:4210 length:657 start_codon:yes stop_codon:yes gene_type:complete
MYIKRSKMPRAWPIPRKKKGMKYIAVAGHSVKKGIPLLFVLRDILKIAKTRKEARHFVLAGDVKINNQVRKSEAFPVQVFDVINLEKAGKNYRLEIVNKKFELKEISEKEAGKKIIKISGKKILGKDKVQMNLEDGGNLVWGEKFSVGDSVVMNTRENKIDKILPLKEGASIEVISGKHAGEKGQLKKVLNLARENVYLIKLKEGEVTLPFKTILVIE